MKDRVHRALTRTSLDTVCVLRSVIILVIWQIVSLPISAKGCFTPFTMHSTSFRDRLFWNNSTSKEKLCYFTPLFIDCMCRIVCMHKWWLCLSKSTKFSCSFLCLSASSETDSTKNGKSWNLFRIGLKCWNQRPCIKQSLSLSFL